MNIANRIVFTRGAALLTLPFLLMACDRTDELVEESKRPSNPPLGTLTKLDKKPRELVVDCLRAYRNADKYSDAAFVRLLYTIDGSLVEDRAPLKVAFDRQSGLGLDVYSVRAGTSLHANARTWQAIVSAAADVDEQILVRELPPEVTAEWINEDVVLNSYLSAGLAGFPVQLDLLLGSETLEAVFGQQSKFDFHSVQEVEARRCAVVTVKTPSELDFSLWIDLDDTSLRRVKFPPEILPPKMANDRRVSDIQLTIEFSNARFDDAGDLSAWTPVAGPEDRFVSRFIPRPPPFNDPLLGKAVPAFDLLSPDNEVVLATSNVRRQDKSLVLLWLANHPASRAAAVQLSQIRKSLQATAPDVASKTEFVSVWAEPDIPGGKSLAELAHSWQMPGKIVVDRAAMGRDVFAITEAPTLIVLDSKGRLQYRGIKADPLLSESLPPLLIALAEGRNIAEESKAAATEAEKRFYKQLESATVPPPLN